MKKALLFFSLLLFGTHCFAQVGINTTDPSSTLDVNGAMRVRSLAKDSNFYSESDPVPVATKIIGLDDEGNFVDVEIDDNLILEGNKLRAAETKKSIGTSTTVVSTTINNFTLLILPGEPNDDKQVIKIISSVGNIDMTGIAAGEDGQVIWILAYNGTVRLRGSNAGSDLENRFVHSGNITLQQYEMAQLLYDGTLQRWVVMTY